MPRNFHVLPREPVKIPMPPVRPTLGPRPGLRRDLADLRRAFWKDERFREPRWLKFVIAAAALALFAACILL